MPHRLIPILVCAALALLGLAATASAASEPWGLMQLRAKGVPLPQNPTFRDTILRHPSHKARAAAAAGTDLVLNAPDGTALTVTISNAYGVTPTSQAASQNAVNFLASRVHGTELGQLKVFVGPPSEISSICGDGDPSVLACYDPNDQRMYVPGETPPNSPVPLEYIITHEFAHHIALHRRNAVGPAFGISASDAGYILGPEYWATSQYVCSGVSAGTFFPNDEGEHYPLNPGEGWAESYAHLPENGFQSAAIQTSPLFHLDQAAFDAIRRDVLQPWQGNVTRTVTGSLGSKSQQRFGLVVSLDGPVIARLTGPSGANYDLQVRFRGKTEERTHESGSRDRLAGAFCAGSDSPPPNRLTFVVVRRSGSGPFKLKLTEAG